MELTAAILEKSEKKPSKNFVAHQKSASKSQGAPPPLPGTQPPLREATRRSRDSSPRSRDSSPRARGSTGRSWDSPARSEVPASFPGFPRPLSGFWQALPALRQRWVSKRAGKLGIQAKLRDSGPSPRNLVRIPGLAPPDSNPHVKTSCLRHCILVVVLILSARGTQRPSSRTP